MISLVHFLTLFVLTFKLSFAANYCGTSFSDASKCSVACPLGLDGECPGSERCYAGVSCNPPPTGAGTTTNIVNSCGLSFSDASKCEMHCPNGLDGECPGSERCFAGVECPVSGSTTPPTSSNSFVGNLVWVTENEYNVYKNKHECYDAAMSARIAQYWAFLSHNLNGCNRDQPWSAAFVSFMVSQAGAGSQFRYSVAHRVYIHDAFSGGRGLYNSALNTAVSTVQTGDIVCSGRGRVSGWRFSDFENWYSLGGINYDSIPTHCDIVVATSGSYITVVGGNVNQEVTRKTVTKSSYAVVLPVTR